MSRWMVVMFAAIAIGSLHAEEFPQFRGVHGSGVQAAQNIPEQWSNDSNVAWKIAVPGAGWSQPVIWGNHVYVTTAVSEKDLRPKNFAAGVRLPQSMGLGGLMRAPDIMIQWQVRAYHTDTGELLWQKTVADRKPDHPVHPSNTYATETPVADAEGVYAFFGATGTLMGFDHTGNVLWKQEFGSFPSSNGFGTGSSVAVHEGKVFVQHFTQGSGSVYCVDTKTGEQRWRFDREKFESSWSSPIVWQNELRTEIIISGSEELDSLVPDTGEVIWKLKNVKAPTACSIAADRKRIYFGGSDPFSKGPLFAMRCGGVGDLSPERKNGEFETCEWLEAKSGPGMPSPVSDGTHLYVVDDSILRCYDAATGNRVYQNRLPKMKQVAGSPIVIGDRLLVMDESGTAVLVKCGSTFEVVGGGKLEDTFWATPAVAHDALFLRGVEALYCIRK